MKHRLIQLVRWHGNRRMPGSVMLAKLARVYLAAYNNENYDIETNGERWLLERLSSFSLSMIFDVGANAGEWSEHARRAHPKTTIHAFEIVPSTFQVLSEKYVSRQINAHPIGLAEKAGIASVKVYEGNDTISTIINTDAIHPYRHEDIEVQVTTGDAFCSENKINNIDLLKIDTEGGESLVLAGFRGMIERQKIDILQFEYGMANIYAQFLLKDYYDQFGHLYEIGQLYPTGVRFSDYRPVYENFRGRNFVAVRRDRQDLIEALSLCE